MSDFLNNLRRITDDLCQKEAAELAKKEQEHLVEIEKQKVEAQAVIATIELKCEAAARKKQTRAVIMQLNSRVDYDSSVRTGDGATLTYTDLRGVIAPLVFDYIVRELGIQPKISWNHDGVGTSNWFDLSITW